MSLVIPTPKIPGQFDPTVAGKILEFQAQQKAIAARKAAGSFAVGPAPKSLGLPARRRDTDRVPDRRGLPRSEADKRTTPKETLVTGKANGERRVGTPAQSFIAEVKMLFASPVGIVLVASVLGVVAFSVYKARR